MNVIYNLKPTFIYADVYNKLSIFSFIVSICDFNCDPSLVMIEAAITERETPQALPSCFIDGTKT